MRSSAAAVELARRAQRAPPGIGSQSASKHQSTFIIPEPSTSAIHKIAEGTELQTYMYVEILRRKSRSRVFKSGEVP